MRLRDSFHTIKVFNLEVYDKRFIQFLSVHDSSGYRCGLWDFLFEEYKPYIDHGYDDDIVDPNDPDSVLIAKTEYYIKKGSINAEWQRFIDWVLTNKKHILRANSIWSRWAPFLYRTIPPEAYEDLLRYGNSTADVEKFGKPDKVRIRGKIVELDKSDFIWATIHLPQIWSGVMNTNPSIIIIYKKKFFTKLREDVWKRKDKNIDFRDTIEAIIRISYF